MIDLAQRKLDVTKSREVKQAQYSEQLTSCRFSPCGKFVFAGAFDGTVQRWDLESDARVALAAHHGWVQDLCFHPDGVRIFSVDSWGKLCAWNYADAEPKPLWSVDAAHSTWIRAVAVSPNGALLATCGDDCAVRLWSAADGKPAGELLGHEKPVHSVAFHPDGKHLVSGDLVGVVHDWDLDAKKSVRTLDAAVLHNVLGDGTYVGGGVRAMAFSPDGTKLICCGITELGSSVVPGIPAAMQFDWAGGKLDVILRPENPEPFKTKGLIVGDVRFHKEGFLVGCGGGGEREGAIWFWKLGQEKPLFEINGNPGSLAIDLHPDGFRLAVAQFLPNGRGINGGNGRHAEPEEYHSHDGLVRIYEMAAPPPTLDDVLDQKVPT